MKNCQKENNNPSTNFPSLSSKVGTNTTTIFIFMDALTCKAVYLPMLHFGAKRLECVNYFDYACFWKLIFNFFRVLKISLSANLNFG